MICQSEPFRSYSRDSRACATIGCIQDYKIPYRHARAWPSGP